MRQGLLMNLALVGAVVLVGASGVFLWLDSPSMPSSGQSHEDAVKPMAVKEDIKESVRKSAVLPVFRKENLLERKKVLEESATALESDEDKLFNDVIGELIKELESAIAKGNRNRITELVKRLSVALRTARGRSSSRVGLLKLGALDLLADLGVDGLPGVIDLLGDSNELVVQTATELLFKTLQDISLGDVDRAEIIVAAAGETEDQMTLLRLYQQLVGMRHSVGVEMLTQISSSGTSAARELLSYAASSHAADPTVKTIKDLQEWLKENPDGPMDDVIYGPIHLELPGK